MFFISFFLSVLALTSVYPLIAGVQIVVSLDYTNKTHTLTRTTLGRTHLDK